MSDISNTRYIGSSDGLRRQSEGLSSIADSTSRSLAKINDSQQQYFKGVQQNSQNTAALQQQLAQIEASSRQSSLSQLSEGVINAIETRDKAKRQTQATALELEKAKAKSDAERLKITQLTKYSQALGDLTDSYEGNNWNNGAEQYKRDSAVIIANLPPDADPDVKRQLLEKVYSNSQNRQKTVGARIAKEQDELLSKNTEVKKAQLIGTIQSIAGNIAQQAISEQAQPFVNQAEDYLNTFLKTDNGLPLSNKLGIVASAIEVMNASYSNKHNRFLETTQKLQDYGKYSYEYSKILVQERAGVIDFDESRRQRELLNINFPGFSDKVNNIGDREERDAKFVEYNERRRELNEQSDIRATKEATFDRPSIAAFIASAYNDPATYLKFKNDPSFKDNPQFQEIIQGADRLTEYYKGSNQLIVQQAAAYVDFAKIDLTNIKNLSDLTRSIARKTQENKPLSATDIIVQDYIGKITANNPQLAETIAQASAQSSNKFTPEQIATLNATLRQDVQGSDSVKQAILTELNAKRNALDSEFRDLANYNFLGQTQEQVRAFAKNSSSFLDKKLADLDRLKLERSQQVEQQQYGQQPNFNQSSNYGSRKDDMGVVRVIPRAAAQLVRLPDGTSVITPIIAGTQAPVTGKWGDNRGTHRHAGVDFALGIGGRPITLVPGRVVHIGNNPRGYGNYVDILGDNGFVYRYAHTAVDVRLNQRLNAGDPVGRSNNSGRSTGAHLHFEVIPNPKIDANGKYTPSLGFESTTDVMKHLQQLTAKSSNVTQPRHNLSAYRNAPQYKVPANSLLTSGGGAINGQTYQRLGGQAGSVNNRTSNQRPVSLSKAVFKVNVGKDIQYDYGDNFGYAELEKDTKLRTAFVNTAKKLGIPTVWLVDIARQESGGINPYKDHDGNAYGLFGHQSDSLNSRADYLKLRAGKIDGEGQLKLYETYLKDNGWDKVVKSKGGAVTIADLWAITRMGWNLRHKFWKSGDLSTPTNGGLTYADELQLLGKWAGRSYALPSSRRQKSSAVSDTLSSYCQICQAMQASSSFAVHQHTG